jgi:hypothetical protein
VQHYPCKNRLLSLTAAQLAKNADNFVEVILILPAYFMARNCRAGWQHVPTCRREIFPSKTGNMHTLKNIINIAFITFCIIITKHIVFLLPVGGLPPVITDSGAMTKHFFHPKKPASLASSTNVFLNYDSDFVLHISEIQKQDFINKFYNYYIQLTPVKPTCIQRTTIQCYIYSTIVRIHC